MVSATAKITSSHLERVAIVYLRQSSPRQVRENFHSTERQYALAEEAARLGWEAERIMVVDGDLGISGRFSDTQARKGYAQLVSRVCVGEVGAIFGRATSRPCWSPTTTSISNCDRHELPVRANATAGRLRLVDQRAAARALRARAVVAPMAAMDRG